MSSSASFLNSTSLLITKILVARIRPIRGDLISPLQSSFLPGRSGLDYVIIVQEVVHSFAALKGTKGNMIIKLDLEKAYDRLEWVLLGNFSPLISLLFGSTSSWRLSWLLPCPFFVMLVSLGVSPLRGGSDWVILFRTFPLHIYNLHHSRELRHCSPKLLNFCSLTANFYVVAAHFDNMALPVIWGWYKQGFFFLKQFFEQGVIKVTNYISMTVSPKIFQHLYQSNLSFNNKLFHPQTYMPNNKYEIRKQKTVKRVISLNTATQKCNSQHH